MTAIATATGVVDTEAILADEKVVDMESEFKLLDPDESQYSTILSRLPSKPAIREKINWLEDQYFPNKSTVSGSQTNSDTAIEVPTGEGAYFRANDIVMNGRTGERFSVTSVATDTLTVVRGLGSVVAGTAMNDGDDLLIVTNASAQNADYGTLKVTTRVLGYNYTQIVRHPFGFSGTDVEIETYGEGDPMNETGKKAVEHKRSLENAYLFGARQFTSASPSSKGFMGGAVEYIATNVFTSIGTLTRSVLDAKLQTIFQHGSMNKVIFAAPTPAAALSGLLADNWVQAQPGERVYGAKVNGFISGAYGARVPVITKRDWGRFSTSSNQLGSWMLVLDLEYVKKRPLRNRGTRLLRNRQGNGIDGVVHEYLTETSIEYAVEQAHGILKGITA